MTKTWNKLKEIIKKDPRYSLQAYQFVFEALDYTTNMLGKNQHKTTDQDRHVTGRQLLEGIRQYASRQFGFMALTVFEEWGINQDADFGNIVFNLVENGLMGKTKRIPEMILKIFTTSKRSLTKNSNSMGVMTFGFR